MRKLLTAKQLEALKACEASSSTGAPNTSSGDKWHSAMKELEEMGFVEGLRQGRKIFWSIREPGEEALKSERGPA